MTKRRGWVVAAAVALGVGALAAWLLASDDPLAAVGLAGDRGAGGHDAPDVLGAGGLGGGDAGVGGAAGLGPLDAGWGSAPPPGWLPTATVTHDPSSPNGSLSGRVVSSLDGAAVEGAELVFEHEGASSSVRTGPDGSFHLRVAQTGRYVLSVASAEGYLPFAPEWGHSAVAFDAVAERRVDGAVVHLTPMIERVVEVRTDDDAPAPGATVTLLGADTGERTMAPVPASFTTDGEGRATVGAWAGATIEATHPDHGLGRGRVGWRRSEAPIVIRLGSPPEEATAAESIAGVVVSPRGSPITGVVVRAYRRSRGVHPVGQGATGPDGRFVVEGLDRGAHMLIATRPDRPRAQLRSVMTGATDARIEMASGAAVTGRVVDDTGQPVPAFTVIARVAPRGGLMRRNVTSTSSYDPEGRFELPGLEPGTYELVATSRGFPPSQPESVTVRATGASPVTLTMARGGRIEGVVRSAADGSPIEGATLSLEGRLGRGSRSPVPLLTQAVSGPDGRYALEGIGETLSSVRVHADGHHSRILGGLQITPGSTRTIDVELTPVEEGEEPRTELAGIGAIMMPRGEALMVRRVVDGGGAQAAGIAPGDLVLAVDGQPVTALGFGGSIDRIRGAEGTTVTLRVQKRGEDAPRDLTIERSRVRT